MEIVPIKITGKVSLSEEITKALSFIKNGNKVKITFDKIPQKSHFLSAVEEIEKILPRESWFLNTKESVFLGILTGKNYSLPIRAVIEIANGCNLKCDFCWTHSPLNNKPPDKSWLKKTLDTESIFKYVEELLEFGSVELIELCAIGDPMYHRDIWKIINYIKELGFRLRLSTNGTLLFPQKWDEQHSGLVDELFMNISAGDAETYSNIHNVGQDIFHQLIINLKHISLSNKNSKAQNLKMRWINVMTSKNIRNLEKIINSAFECGADYLDFRYVWIHQDFQKDINFIEDDINFVINNQNSIKNLLADLKIENNFNNFLSSVIPVKNIPYSVENSNQNSNGSVACTVPYHFTLLDVNKELRFCCRGDKIKSRYDNILKQWDDGSYSEFRNFWSQSYFEKKGICLGCPHHEENKTWTKKFTEYLSEKEN